MSKKIVELKSKKKGETGVKKAREGGMCRKCEKRPWTYWSGYCDQCAPPGSRRVSNE